MILHFDQIARDTRADGPIALMHKNPSIFLKKVKVDVVRLL